MGGPSAVACGLRRDHIGPGASRRLAKFYHGFHANYEQDPTGYKTLQEILAHRDMERFQQEWEAWVSKLRFP